MSKVINFPGRVHSTEVGNVMTGANEILDDHKGKKQDIINAETDAELLRLDNEKQNALTFDNTPTENSDNPVKSGGVFAADKALSHAIEAILLLIPQAASALNKLTDKEYVDDQISTATATFKGTYNLVSDLELAVDATHAQIQTALSEAIGDADNNDYAFVQIPVSVDDPTEIAKTERYKFDGTAWLFEYELNTSGFTSAQWDAINSGITFALVTKLADLPTYASLQELLAHKQDVLTFDSTPIEGSNNPVKSGGIFEVVQAVASALMTYENSINALIPSEATALNQLADKAYVVAQIIVATPAFKGLFASLLELQAVENPKTGDIGLVRAKDNDGYDVFIFYQFKDDEWNEYYTLARTPLRKPATTGTSGDYPCNGMGKIELPMDIVSGTWPDNTWLYLPLDGVVYLLYSWRMQLYAVYDEDNEAGLGLDNNIVIQPVGYDITKIANLVGERYMSFTEAGGVYTITNPDGNNITSTQLNNTTIYNYRDGSDYMVNLLTQAMFTQQNTIYVVQHDYDLNAQNISIPANSTLLFDGGTIKNGTITGNGLKLCAELHYEYMQDVTLAGDYTDETSKSLQTQIDAIVSGNTNVSLTANKSEIFAEVATAVNLSATSNKSATLINIKKGSTVLATGSGTSLSATDNVTPSGAGTITYQADFTILGFVKSTTRSISAVYPVRTGSGTSYVDGVASTTPKTSPVGTYDVVVAENEQYIYINVPAHMNYDIKGKATMGGFDFPLEDATDVIIGGVAYKSYRSSNTYNAGTWTIVIS